jgi:hypothetical protein
MAFIGPKGPDTTNMSQVMEMRENIETISTVLLKDVTCVFFRIHRAAAPQAELLTADYADYTD